MRHSLFAACLPGLEPLCAEELRRLGAQPRPEPGGVAFEADRDLLLRAHLHLGTASHLLLRCAEFVCLDLAKLERKVASLPWTDWLLPNAAVQVEATSRKSRLYHTGAIEERVGNGIRRAIGTAADDDGPKVAVSVRFLGDQATISIDTAAEPLHRRGYRLATAKAPLREDLAHALLLAGGYGPGVALLDPFCGSGTIAIEAAAMAAGLPPGRLRPAPLMGTPLGDEAAWRRLLAATPRAPVGPIAGSRILASDRDEGAVTAARQNAERAGVLAAIEFEVQAVSASPWLVDPSAAPRPLLVATNPPFGRRVAPGKSLLPLYQTLGRAVLGLHDARLCLLAADVRLARRTGIPLHAAFSTRHGGLSVTAMVGQATAQPGGAEA